jgi:hypothetical protein
VELVLQVLNIMQKNVEVKLDNERRGALHAGLRVNHNKRVKAKNIINILYPHFHVLISHYFIAIRIVFITDVKSSMNLPQLKWVLWSYQSPILNRTLWEANRCTCLDIVIAYIYVTK